MDTRLKVSIQSAKWKNLSGPQQCFLVELRKRLEGASLKVMPDSPASVTLDEQLEIIRRSHGVIILAFNQWEGHRDIDKKSVIFPTEFTHIAAVMAVAAPSSLFRVAPKNDALLPLLGT